MTVSSPMTVFPRRCVLGPMIVSRPMRTVGPIYVDSRIGDGHTKFHPLAVDALAQQGFGFSQMNPGINSDGFIEILQNIGLHLSLVFAGDGHHIRQVIFALG